ncbi:MAG TPA: hypothetical protein VLI06_17430 [Solimonas sp.]|nr:hypothetical protein [Solimonas sp.]
MKFLHLLGTILLAGVSFAAGSSFETSGHWTPAASFGMGMVLGALLLALALSLWPSASRGNGGNVPLLRSR